MPVDGNTNMFYPYPSGFYYEGLHYPPAFLAAILVGVFHAGPILSYNICFVAFWSLSGACLWLLLKELGINRVVCFAMAAIFTILPYKMRYVVEFNMQLNLGVILFLLFLVRYFKRPNIVNALFCCLSLWLQAICELYHAVFLSLLLPFVLVPLFRKSWREILPSFRKFWLPMAIAGVAGLILAGYFLWPYARVLDNSLLVRKIEEVAKHVMEPASYITPPYRGGIVPYDNAIQEETCAYPTLAVVLLAMVALVWSQAKRAGKAGVRLVVQKGALWIMLAALAVVFLQCVCANATGKLPLGVNACVLPIYIACAAAVAYVFAFDVCECDENECFFRGLGCAAVLAIALSLGPNIHVTSVGDIAPNLVYGKLYQYCHALWGFRVVARFSFFVLLFVVVAAAKGLDLLLALADRIQNARWRKCAAIALPVAAFALVWIESVCLIDADSPVRDGMKKFEPIDDLPSVRYINSLPEPPVLAVLPMNFREQNSREMLRLAIEQIDMDDYIYCGKKIFKVTIPLPHIGSDHITNVDQQFACAIKFLDADFHRYRLIDGEGKTCREWTLPFRIVPQ